jgi:hypothetical protein
VLRADSGTKGGSKMKIEAKHPITLFSELNPGDVFFYTTLGSAFLYMKTEQSDQPTINAVHLSNGSWTSFRSDAPVTPWNCKLIGDEK